MSDQDGDSKKINLAFSAPSLILYGILVGFSIEAGIERLLLPTSCTWVLLNFITLLFIAIRFFPGIYIENERASLTPRRALGNFAFLFVELIILAFIGRMVDNLFIFLNLLIGLSLLDISWAFISFFWEY